MTAAINESAEEPYDNSNVIIVGNAGDYEEVTVRGGDRKYVERHYDVDVKKILSNTSETDLDAEDTISFPLRLESLGRRYR